MGAGAPGCLLPELIVDGTDGLGGEGPDDTGGSGGDGTGGGGGNTGGGGGDSGGGDSGGSDSGGGDSGGASTGGTGSGGEGTGGDGTGGGSGGGSPIGGYYESGDWYGYMFPLANAATIDPATFEETLGPPFCVAGVIEPTEAYDGLGGVGWNLNQDTCSGADCPSSKGTVTPSLEGVTLRLDNPDGNMLRLQAEGPNGGQDANERWCIDLGALDGSTFVPWSSFNTMCWAPGEGNDYANEPLQNFLVYAYGEGTGGDQVPFDFCIENLEESDAPSATCSLSDSEGTGTYSLSTDLEYIEVNREGHSYLVHNNFFNAAGTDQTVQGTGTRFEVLQQTGNLSTSGQPLGFPSVFIGDRQSLSSDTSGLPKLVGDISTLPTAWEWANAPSGTYLALYELTFSSSQAGAPVAFIQILLGGNVTPIGTSQGNVLIEGQTWELWIGTATPEGTVYSYRTPTTRSSFTGDLAPFVDDAVNQGMPSSYYLQVVSAGFQIWAGGVGLVSENFCALVP